MISVIIQDPRLDSRKKSAHSVFSLPAKVYFNFKVHLVTHQRLTSKIGQNKVCSETGFEAKVYFKIKVHHVMYQGFRCCFGVFEGVLSILSTPFPRRKCVLKRKKVYFKMKVHRANHWEISTYRFPDFPLVLSNIVLQIQERY